jgi:hypothetical protein
MKIRGKGQRLDCTPSPQGADFHRPVEITLLCKFTLPNLSA